MKNFDPTAKQLWQENVVSAFQTDHFDLLDYRSAEKIIPHLRRDNLAAAADIGGQPVQDGFFSLYKHSPTFSDDPSPVQSLIKKGMETPDWQKLRENTVSQIVGAGLGAQHFWSNVIANLPEEVKADADTQHKARQNADEASQQAESLQALSDLLAAAGNDSEAQAAGLLAAKQQLVADQFNGIAEDMQEKFEQTLEEFDAQVSNVMNQAAGVAAGEAADGNTWVKAFTEAAGGAAGHIDPTVAEKAMEVLRDNPNLTALAEFLGWAKQTCRGEWRDATKGSKYMTGYEISELRPAKLAASERLAMISANPAVRADFSRRVIEGSVSHVKFEGGEDQQGNGPLVVIDDQSGSMSGKPHSLTTALIWSLLEIARRDKREFYNISFSGRGQVKLWTAPPVGQPDAAGLINHLSHFYNGGTEPYQAINMALDLIDDQDLKADVLVITDESFSEPAADFIARCRESQANIVSVLVGGGTYQRTAEKFSNYVLSVGSLINDKNRLKEVLRRII